ncbi:DUF4235 domain-containing protein [Luteolibacter pohnpeiensis]|uniref:DUF4235 domain-containing protein n=1 Tax=Luteolibacter pohnpeiensis TaxID=454153 RepID=A0A934S8D1_9BACT|nr:DUF4235 domain-containing protein [Luteolibacter pohnpeiensis]MBK1881244.1 DUF4235 domain-containing protein [Luteolibacter pohnpeiensis]
MKSSKISSLSLIGLGLILPAIAARAARSAAGAGYHAVTHMDPPKNPAHPDVAWKDAIVWTLVSGMIGGLTRLVVRRSMAGSPVPAEGYDLEKKADRLV